MSKARTSRFVYRYADGQYNRLPTLVADLINWQVALIRAFGPPAAQAAKAATTTIPIVFTSIDPVKFGLVASLNRPGGNATGVHVVNIDLEGKRLELLSETVPASSPVVALINPYSDHDEKQAKDVQAGGPAADATRQRTFVYRCPLQGTTRHRPWWL